MIHRENMKGVAKRLDADLRGVADGKRQGFILLTFPLETTGMASWITNVRADDAMRTLREFVETNQAGGGMETPSEN